MSLNTEVRDHYLAEIKKMGTHVSVYLLNGINLRGKIVAKDDVSIILRGQMKDANYSVDQLIQFVAMASITPNN